MNVDQVKIKLFDKAYNRRSFDCGNKILNEYLQKKVSQDIKRDLTCCYLIISEEGEIAGFYTLSSSCVLLDSLPDILKAKLRYSTIPVALLGRLAVDQRAQKKGLGRIILADAVKRVKASGMGVYALFVEAKDKKAKGFYEKHGFTSRIEKPKSLFLPLSSISKKTV